MKITLTDLIKTLSDGKDYTEGTQIIINRNELTYDKNLSVYNFAYFKHNPSGGYLYVVYHDDENYVNMYIIFLGENPKDSRYDHHLCDDESDDMYWNKLDDDFQFDEFEVVYKDELN